MLLYVPAKLIEYGIITNDGITMSKRNQELFSCILKTVPFPTSEDFTNIFPE